MSGTSGALAIYITSGNGRLAPHSPNGPFCRESLPYPEFLERYNERFAVRAVKPENLHRTLNVVPARLNDILCHREHRYVGQQLTLSYDRKQIILERSDLSENLAGQYVELYDFPR
jgi:hypothetical protein